MNKDYDIVGSYNNQRVSSIDAERSVNLFEYRDPLGKKPRSLINTSGLINTDFSFGSETGGFRGQFVFDNNQYCVVGRSVFLINSIGNISLLGTLINTNTGYVGIDANTFQVIFVDGINGYIWDTNALTFELITDQSFPVEPIDVCNLDGFFVVANGNTNNFQLSMFNQGMVWGVGSSTFTASSVTDELTVSSTANFATGIPVTLSTTGSLPTPLNNTDTYYTIRIDNVTLKLATSYENAILGTFIDLMSDGTPTNTITSLGQLQLGSITTHPGNIVACRTLHRRLFLFSEFFTEVWENAGIGTNLPFRRNNSLLMEVGTPSIGSIAVGFDIMIFQSQSRDGLGSVSLVRGSQDIPISTRALDFQLAQYAAQQQISDCRGFLVKENGLIFYRMNFTAANHTFIYNVTLSEPTSGMDENKLWHEEELLNGDRHPAQTHAYFNGINYVGHYSMPLLYVLDSQTYSNDGESIRRMRIGKAIVPPTYQRLRIDRFQLDLLQGNKAGIPDITFELDLLTEDGDLLLTEGDEPIELEQSQQPHVEIAPPYVFLSISRDGGQTYGYSIKAPMGKVGERTFRTLWRKLGTTPRGQAFVPKIEFFNQIPIVILGASWSFEILPE